MRKVCTRFLCGSFLVAMLASCGEGDLGGGIGEFTTVKAGAEAGTLRLESDILTGNSCSDATATGAYTTDSVDFTITSTREFTTGNALDLLVTKATVHYDPVRSGSPRLPDEIIPLRVTVAPGSAVAIPVAVLTDLTKSRLVSDPALLPNLIPCTGDYYEYYVTVTFEVSEPGGNGKTENIPAYFRLAIADRVSG